MSTRAGRLIVWIALAACGGASKPSPPQPPPAAPVAQAGGEVACQQAVDAMFAVTAQDESPDLRALSAKVLVRRCEADRWSAELRGCMAAVKTPEDGDRCEAMLTPEQKNELAHELARELEAAGVRPEVDSGKPKPAPEEKKMERAKSKPAPASAPPKAPGRTADPCEGGE